MSNWSFYNAVQAAKRRIIAAGYADRMAAKPNAGGSMREAIERIEAHADAAAKALKPDPPDA